MDQPVFDNDKLIGLLGRKLNLWKLRALHQTFYLCFGNYGFWCQLPEVGTSNYARDMVSVFVGNNYFFGVKQGLLKRVVGLSEVRFCPAKAIVAMHLLVHATVQHDGAAAIANLEGRSR